MPIDLRNGQTTEDPRLDRIREDDTRNHDFPIRELLRTVETKQPRNWRWRCDQTLDQGREGACVGFAWAHELITTPLPVVGITDQWAQGLYYDAQRNDPWPGGEYPGAYPVNGGTSVLSGVKQLKARGFCTGYRWGFTLNDLIMGVGYRGPAVIGIDWWSAMYQPDEQNLIHQRGDKVGGHAILVRGVVPTYRYFILRNSWGADYGQGGDVFVSFPEMEKMLRDDGEICFLDGRRYAAL